MRMAAASSQEGEIEKYSNDKRQRLEGKSQYQAQVIRAAWCDREQREVRADVPEDVTTAQGPEHDGAYFEQETCLRRENIEAQTCLGHESEGARRLH